MRLLFLGDIGVPEPVPVPPNGFAEFDRADLVVANLEGAILPAEPRDQPRERRAVALYNAPDVLDALRAFRVGAVGLANNHTYDFDTPIGPTKAWLERSGIGGFGAGGTLEEAAAPFVASASGTTAKLFAFGWPGIGCKAARGAREGINPLEPGHVLETAHRARREDGDAFIAFLMHWNYELELYPQPAHRQLAHDLVEAGVDAVIGGHPHVASGVELVNGSKPVCYSLGNWLFPPRSVNGFRVSYPPVARRQLAVELEVAGREVRDVRLRWYDYDPDRGRIEAEGVESATGRTALELTPYAGMSRAEYARWFTANRTRGRGLPVYRDYRARSNGARDTYLRFRRGAGELLARLGLKREQRPDTESSSEGAG